MKANYPIYLSVIIAQVKHDLWLDNLQITVNLLHFKWKNVFSEPYKSEELKLFFLIKKIMHSNANKKKIEKLAFMYWCTVRWIEFLPKLTSLLFLKLIIVNFHLKLNCLGINL